MIRYVRHDKINKKKWDTCIRNSFNGNIYGYSWFLNIVAENWDALIEDDYRRVFPLPWKKKFGIYHLYQPFFTQQLGIYSQNILSSEVVQNFIDHIPSKFKYIDLFLNSHNKIEKPAFKVVPQVNHELDLIKSHEDLRKSYSKNTLRNIKKAGKNGLSFVENIKPERLVDLFRYNKGKDIPHLKENDYRRLRRLLYTCMYKRMAGFYGVYSAKNELVAAAVFLTATKRAVFIFSGLSEQGRNSGAMPFLIDSFIGKFAHTHLTLDFDGSNDPNLARFYKGFGAKKISYPRLTINKLPAYVRVPFWIWKELLKK